MNWSNIEEAASLMAGNHRQFESFAWHDRPDDDMDWCIVHTNHRDSDLLEVSNAEAIAKALAPYLEEEEPDILSQHFGHWAVGWVDGYAIRVWKDNVITQAFRKYASLMEALQCYPALDEQDFSHREYEATLENIADAARGLIKDDAPEDWEGDAFSWFWDNDQSAVEPRDGGGGYPSEKEMKACLFALSWLEPEHYYVVVADDQEVGKFLDYNDALGDWERRLGEPGRVFVTQGGERVFPEEGP